MSQETQQICLKELSIQLSHYWILELLVNAELNYDDSEAPFSLTSNTEGFVISTSLSPAKDGQHIVQLTLRLPEKPLVHPYAFNLCMIGKLKTEQDSASWYIETIGSTLLYSAARDILHSIMSRGPYLPIVLPTISFVPKPEITEDLTNGL